MKTDREKIIECKKNMAKQSEIIDKIMEKYLGQDKADHCEVSELWNCAKSPLGLCVYPPISSETKLSEQPICMFCNNEHRQWIG